MMSILRSNHDVRRKRCELLQTDCELLQTDWGMAALKFRVGTDPSKLSEPVTTNLVELSKALNLPSSASAKLYGAFVPLELPPEDGTAPKGISSACPAMLMCSLSGPHPFASRWFVFRWFVFRWFVFRWFVSRWFVSRWFVFRWPTFHFRPSSNRLAVNPAAASFSVAVRAHEPAHMLRLRTCCCAPRTGPASKPVQLATKPALRGKRLSRGGVPTKPALRGKKRSRGGVPTKAVLRAVVARDLQQVVLYDTDGQFAGVRRPGSGKPQEVDGQWFVIDEIVGASGMQMKNDPGTAIVYFGFGCLMVTTIVSYTSHSQVRGSALSATAAPAQFGDRNTLAHSQSSQQSDHV